MLSTQYIHNIAVTCQNSNKIPPHHVIDLMARFEEFSPEDVRDYIQEEIPQIEKDVLEKIVLHKIDGETFLVLNDEYLWEIAPLLGDRLKMKKLIVKLQVVEEPLVSFMFVYEHAYGLC